MSREGHDVGRKRDPHLLPLSRRDKMSITPGYPGVGGAREDFTSPNGA